MGKRGWVFLGGCVFALCLCRAQACFARSPQERIIRVAGSTTVLPAVSRAAERFMRAHPGVRITVNPGGSGVGVKSLARGLVDIGMASREIDAEERNAFPAVDFNLWVIGRDAVACVVSSQIYEAGVNVLSKPDIRAIYSGEIGNWSDVGGPDRPILVIDKEMHRGTRHVFMAYVFGDKKARAEGADLVSGSNNEEQAKVALSDAAIGMLSLAWINKDVRGVGIKEQGKVINPTLENIRNGSYPISRNLNLITNGRPEGIVRQFIDYILGPEGQKIVEEMGYVAIRSQAPQAR
ncbi:MAG: phosphate ABC transporter substrate-binding protein [Candidatus Omnitrophota bacterium]